MSAAAREAKKRVEAQAKAKKKVKRHALKRTVRIPQPDGSFIEKVEIVKDQKVVRDFIEHQRKNEEGKVEKAKSKGGRPAANKKGAGATKFVAKLGSLNITAVESKAKRSRKPAPSTGASKSRKRERSDSEEDELSQDDTVPYTARKR